ncbi:MAG TPA: hypothetical protein VJ948_08155 [Acidimicrobiia bacterium]|nr:hypothetical protein [Acidimicrobiia bacterium]
MELNRLLRILHSRWPIVALIAAAGFASSFGLTALSVGETDPVFEASTAIQFELQGEETIEDLAGQIETERGIAAFAAQDLIAEYPGSSIFSDTTGARLVFVARANSSEEASSRVRELVAAYLDADPSSGRDVSGKLSELERQTVEIQAEIDALQPVLTMDEQALKDRHDLLDLKMTKVREEILALTVANAGATAEQQQENAERIADLEAQLGAMQLEKAGLPPAPSTELDAVGLLQLDSLNRILEFIKLEYQRYQMRTFGITGTGGTLQPTGVQDLTPDPPNPLVNGGIGLLGGAGIALLALVLTTRARKEVWLADDLPIPVLGAVPLRKVTALPGPSWYDATSGGRRKESVQAVRTAIDGLIQHEPTGLVIVRDRVGATDAHALAVDLAASFASAGRSVLLIAADYLEHVDISEYDVGEPTLSAVLRLPPGPPETLDARINDLLDDAVSIRADLTVMSAGTAPESPADSLAGPQFRRFLSLARQRYDLLLAVGGDAGSSASQVLVQRLGAAILTVAPGKTTQPRVNAVLLDLNQQRVQLPGAIMLHGSESRIGLPANRTSTIRRQPAPALLQTETVSRLRFYPFPGEKRWASDAHGSLDHLVEALTVDGKQEMASTIANGDGDPFGAQVADALESSDRSTAYEPVADYVVARVEDMLTAEPGQANASDDLIDVVFERGFIPLTAVKDVPTVWHWLVLELEHEVGIANGQRIAGQIARTLTGVELPGPDEMDRWLSAEFFRRHLERTDREPNVWHITSPNGAVQLLVNGRRLTDDKLGRMATDIVRRRIHELERALKESRQAGEADAGERFEADLRDAHRFEISLGVLRGGGSEEARLVYPWRKHDQRPRGWSPIWSEGVRPNIAPLQRLDLLPRPVLTDEELEALVSTG